ncbi:periphilin-1-like [Nomascus leucogenys]|uniref:periphilin-1-like n=1 Tax=Nomascus leucogenys TaxID=61853 RepID=UPI00020AF3DD|nr:periphilin-1-like [Nomascus leucogenys]
MMVMTRKAPDITWGQLKKLNQQASIRLPAVEAPATADNRFLTYLAVIGETSEKVRQTWMLGWRALADGSVLPPDASMTREESWKLTLHWMTSTL